jgi:hypothetical protein
VDIKESDFTYRLRVVGLKYYDREICEIVRHTYYPAQRNLV